jgi:hypothetical protein
MTGWPAKRSARSTASPSWIEQPSFCKSVLEAAPPLSAGAADGTSSMLEGFARGWDNLVGRWGGPMSFRFLMQPAVAIFFAIRAGLNDARHGEPPFLGYLLRRERWSEIWKHVGKVFIVALILDSIYQASMLGESTRANCSSPPRSGRGSISCRARSCHADRESCRCRNTIRSRDGERQSLRKVSPQPPTDVGA